MNTQEPAEGIMKTGDYNTCKSYEVNCSCGNADDTLSFFVEVDEGTISVSTYTTQKTDWWTDYYNKNAVYQFKNPVVCYFNYVIRGFLNSLSHRLKLTYNIWVDGYVTYEQCTIMSKQQALNYANTLLTAINSLNSTKEKPNVWDRLRNFNKKTCI